MDIIRLISAVVIAVVVFWLVDIALPAWIAALLALLLFIAFINGEFGARRI